MPKNETNQNETNQDKLNQDESVVNPAQAEFNELEGISSEDYKSVDKYEFTELGLNHTFKSMAKEVPFRDGAKGVVFVAEIDCAVWPDKRFKVSPEYSSYFKVRGLAKTVYPAKLGLFRSRGKGKDNAPYLGISATIAPGIVLNTYFKTIECESLVLLGYMKRK